MVMMMMTMMMIIRRKDFPRQSTDRMLEQIERKKKLMLASASHVGLQLTIPSAFDASSSWPIRTEKRVVTQILIGCFLTLSGLAAGQTNSVLGSPLSPRITPILFLQEEKEGLSRK